LGKYGKEVQEANQEVERLRRLLPAGRIDLADKSDAAFDRLIEVSLRY
jgi:hypothetical protein